MKRRPPSARDRADAVVIDALLATAGTPEGMYGRLKMVPYLRKQGLTVSARQVDRLMRVLGMRGRSRGRGIRTTIADRNAERAPDLLDPDFTAPAPNQRWVADFTYVRTSWIPAVVATLAMRSWDAGEKIHRAAAVGVHGVDRPGRVGEGCCDRGRGASGRGLQVDETSGIVDAAEHPAEVLGRGEGVVLSSARRGRKHLVRSPRTRLQPGNLLRLGA
ncbi:IS3 family transposase [Demequina lutea]|uniref:IS3 family transposase n=1 Tax=Demequina lutea TaxID=431489 RepID=UPI0015C9EB88